MTDHTESSIAPNQTSFVVYIFKEHGENAIRQGRKRLSWLRDSVCNDLATALTKAEVMRMQPGVDRVQVFERTLDKDGQTRTGRIVRTLNQSRWRELLGFS